MNVLLLSLAMIASSHAIDALQAREHLDAARAQYSAAAYEDALVTLARTRAALPHTRVEVEQFRALCLIALGRTSDAERAVAAMVDANPRYLPSADVASPSVLSLISEMRRKELPAAARRLLDDGRAAFETRDLPRAQGRFELLLELLDDPDAEDIEGRGDVRTLAEGFVTLTAALLEPAPRSGERADTPEPGAPGKPPVVEPAVPIRQEMPAWVPPDLASGARTYRGAIKVRIGEDGRVKWAAIEEPTHPAFDVRLLSAAREWLFQPATRDGVPVESDRLVAIQLNPPQ